MTNDYEPRQISGRTDGECRRSVCIGEVLNGQSMFHAIPHSSYNSLDEIAHFRFWLD